MAAMAGRSRMPTCPCQAAAGRDAGGQQPAVDNRTHHHTRREALLQAACAALVPWAAAPALAATAPPAAAPADLLGRISRVLPIPLPESFMQPEPVKFPRKVRPGAASQLTRAFRAVLLAEHAMPCHAMPAAGAFGGQCACMNACPHIEVYASHPLHKKLSSYLRRMPPSLLPAASYRSRWASTSLCCS